MPIRSSNRGFQLDAGRSREQVVFWNPVDAIDHGEKTQTWEEAHSGPLWAEVLPAKSRDIERAAQLGVKVDYRVTVRYRDDIDERQQITWRGKTLTIAGVPEDVKGQKVALSILAVEVK